MVECEAYHAESHLPCDLIPQKGEERSDGLPPVHSGPLHSWRSVQVSVHGAQHSKARLHNAQSS